MKRVGKNSIALGLVVALISLALSFSASGATTTHHVAHAEARYLAGTTSIGDIADSISQQLEGESADCSAAEVAALTGDAECEKENLDNDTALPLGGAAGLTLGAVDNYAGVSGSAAANASHPNSLASSGVVGDDGFIDTDYAGPKGSVTLSLDNGELTGPIGANLADVQAQFGAVSAEATAVKGDVSRRYNIASATVTAKVKVLDTLNQEIEDALAGYDLLGTLSGTDQLTLGKLTSVAPGPLQPITDLAPLESLVDIDVTFPSLTDLTTAVADYSNNGVQIAASDGTVTVDLVDLLDTPSIGGINNLPAGTDLMTYVLPAIAQGLDTLVTDLFAAVADEIVDNTSVTVTLLGIPAVTLNAPDLGNLLDPLATGLNGELTPAGTALTDGLTTALDQDALAPVLQLKVNNHDLYGQELVAGDVAASSVNAALSQTALRIVMLDGELADLRLGNAVVVPDGAAVTADDADTDTQAAQDQDTDADAAAAADADADLAAPTDADADANADAAAADADAAADAAADANADAVADAVADADVTAALPNTGAPNILPLLLLALGLIGFGTAVLVNEKRRMGQL